MKITTVLFDLDGTLLPMDQDEFVRSYFKLLAKKVAPLGYDPASLIDNIWAGTAAMVKNDGSRKNEEAFWAQFAKFYGDKVYDDIPVFDKFYSEEFNLAKDVCGFAPNAKKIVDGLCERGFEVVLATNPIFPPVATLSRISWAGLSAESFSLITNYSNSSYCKPNPKYYEEILSKIGKAPEECLMVGNDVEEDMVAQSLGMKVFLLTDCIINKKDRDISVYPHGGFDDLAEYLQTI
ncbi:MAG: HAD family hydrolase [Clostridia bacterium]|nr:HAD family hydrolase [Clostridia bacterium]